MIDLTGEKVSRLTHEWRKAEKQIKRTERVVSKLVIPAINELRYAGTHFIDAISASDESVADDELEKAVKHCRRAMYDAAESEILFYLEKLRQFQEDYRTIRIKIDGFDYTALRARAGSLKKILVRGRTDEQTKDDYYEHLCAQCDTFMEDVEMLDAARDELNKDLSKDRSDARRWRALAIIALLAMLGAWAKVYVASASAHDTRPPQSSFRDSN